MASQAIPLETSLRQTSGPANFTRQLKEQARVLGFQKVGVVRAEALVDEDSRLREWLARGYAGEMHWMARDPGIRADPRKVSRYAWGDDYHEVLGRKLRQLLEWITERVPQAKGKVCVDIQPLMDKAWDARAGLGWIGKHTNLITSELGSWVFIGELLLSIDLEYDSEQVEDHCGNCTLCIDACPTQAITEPYVLDSNKCISYATIELRAPEIPEEVGTKLEDWLYGCDICQAVCPWNRFEQVSSETAFEPRPGNVNINLAEILDLTPEGYADRFRNSAMKRAKLSGLQRNARRLIENEAGSKASAALSDGVDSSLTRYIE